MKKVASSSTHSEIIDYFNEAKNHSDFTKTQKKFIERIVDRMVNITLEEKDALCSCNTNNLWTVLSYDHKVVFDKLVLGTPLSSRDIKSLKQNAVGFIPNSNGGPGVCLLKSLNLYDEMLRIL